MLQLKNMRRQNSLPVLNILNGHGPISRAELARRLHCNGTTVTRIIKDLIDLGLVKALGLDNSTGGRPKELIELNADWKYAIGIALDPDYITGVIINLKGQIIVREQVIFKGGQSSRDFLNTLITLSDRLLAACDRQKLLGIGIAAFGTFSDDNKILENVAQLPELEKFDLKKFFKQKYGIEVEVSNTVVAKTFNEIWFNRNGVNANLLVIVAGSGIGCTAAIDGRIVFNKHGHGGELGHTIYQVGGETCECGKRGCLETLCSLKAIRKKVAAKTGKTLTISELTAAYADGDAEVTEIVDAAAKWLGIAVANQINLLAPDEIVLTGEIMKFGDRFLRIIEETATTCSFPIFLKNLKIIRSSAEEETTAIGAGAFVISKIFENFTSLETN
jgi:predicted NBD/HSP70 family sugar kinase